MNKVTYHYKCIKSGKTYCIECKDFLLATETKIKANIKAMAKEATELTLESNIELNMPIPKPNNKVKNYDFTLTFDTTTGLCLDKINHAKI